MESWLWNFVIYDAYIGERMEIKLQEISRERKKNQNDKFCNLWTATSLHKIKKKI